MRAFAVLLFSLAMSGCVGASSVEGGVATYDVLKQAQDRCASAGGAMQLKKGGDPQYISDYACKRN